MGCDLGACGTYKFLPWHSDGVGWDLAVDGACGEDVAALGVEAQRHHVAGRLEHHLHAPRLSLGWQPACCCAGCTQHEGGSSKARPGQVIAGVTKAGSTAHGASCTSWGEVERGRIGRY
jgi:hypothetical protein